MEAQEGREKMQIGRKVRTPSEPSVPKIPRTGKLKLPKTKASGKNVKNDDDPLKVLPPSERSEPAPSVAKLAIFGGIGGPAQNKMPRERERS